MAIDLLALALGYTDKIDSINSKEWIERQIRKQEIRELQEQVDFFEERKKKVNNVEYADILKKYNYIPTQLKYYNETQAKEWGDRIINNKPAADEWAARTTKR